LESIIHPQVKDKLQEIFNEDYDIVFVSVPQLFEAGFETLFDKTIYITADSEIRKKRLMERNSLTSEEAQIRINAQDEADKKDKCDFVIENNGNIEELKTKVKNLLSILVR
jgi:dephospho-CoA kinase